MTSPNGVRVTPDTNLPGGIESTPKSSTCSHGSLDHNSTLRRLPIPFTPSGRAWIVWPGIPANSLMSDSVRQTTSAPSRSIRLRISSRRLHDRGVPTRRSSSRPSWPHSSWVRSHGGNSRRRRRCQTPPVPVGVRHACACACRFTYAWLRSRSSWTPLPSGPRSLAELPEHRRPGWRRVRRRGDQSRRVRGREGPRRRLDVDRGILAPVTLVPSLGLRPVRLRSHRHCQAELRSGSASVYFDR